MYDPKKHHRQSIRLKGYDYTNEGMYFVTVCVHQNACLFGTIADGVMHCNDAGNMLKHWYAELGNKFTNIRCDAMVVMPNHFHCIIQIINKTEDSLSSIIHWFKTMTTNAYLAGVKQHHWTPFSERLWHRNYYEHIIRNQESYEEISAYITTNPLRWDNDKFNVP